MFVVRPATRPAAALARGALFGLIAYATYDMTNLATLKGFPLWIALVDMAWGVLISGCACAVARVARDAARVVGSSSRMVFGPSEEKRSAAAARMPASL